MSTGTGSDDQGSELCRPTGVCLPGSGLVWRVVLRVVPGAGGPFLCWEALGQSRPWFGVPADRRLFAREWLGLAVLLRVVP